MVFLGACGYGLVSTPNVVENVANHRVEQVNIEGEINFISEQKVLGAVNSYISESLLLVDMDEIKIELEAMPWIRSVDIRREWPDTIVLSVVEEKAIARWGDTRLLNQDGAIFSPENIIGLESLAILSGPTGSERQVMEQYQLFSQLLYQRGLKIAELNLSERSAWKLTLANGVGVNVGKSEVMKRMKRLVEFAEPALIEQMPDIESIDLRYMSGIAVKTKENKVSEVVSL
jgi:cell division protein FtsQ